MKTQEQLDEYRKIEKTEPDRGAKMGSGIGWFAVIVIMALVCVALARNILTQGANAVKNAYAESKDKTTREVYDQFYQEAYDQAKEKYLVMNQATISLDGLREESKLEVLHIQNVIYEIVNNDSSEQKGILQKTTKIVSDAFLKEPEAWLEIPGYGVFTVNMKLAEFIVDDENHYVLVRIPKPELDTVQIVPQNIKTLYLQNGGWLRNSVEDGETLINGSIQDASLRMKQEIENNQEFYKRAEDSSKTILENLVRKLNMNIKDLNVEVEFVV